MRTLVEQINWLSDTITILEIEKTLYLRKRPWMTKSQRNKTLKRDGKTIRSFLDILESLLILNDRDSLCDNCVNNYFDNQN